jgi:hypothetical protein
MSTFKTPLKVSLVDPDFGRGRGQWQLEAPLIYQSDVANKVIEVPVGFTTDFASVLRLPLMYSLFGDKAHAAATVHDYLYTVKVFPRRLCDDVFLEAIEVSTSSYAVTRRAMWLAVRIFGGNHY